MHLHSYGERGYEVIMGTLSQIYLVDESPLSEEKTRPLDAQSYMRRVLLPEVATALIEVDMKCGRDEALEILQESRQYGLAVFAIQDCTDEEMGMASSQAGGDEEEEVLELDSQESSEESEKGDKAASIVLSDEDDDDDLPDLISSLPAKRVFTRDLFSQRPRNLRKPSRAVG
jgi:hypothetical protein